MSQAAQLLQQVIAAYHDQDLARARALLDQLEALEPDNPYVWHWRAYCATDEQDRQSALERVIRLDPNSRIAKSAAARLAGMADASQAQEAALPQTLPEPGRDPADAPPHPKVVIPPPDKAAQAGDDDSLHADDIVGDSFKILGPLGGGGFGRVYRARDIKTGKDCVVKQLIRRQLMDHADPSRVASSLEREVRLLIGLNNNGVENIPHIVGYVPDRLCLVMDYIKGDTLAVHQQRRRGKLDEREALLYTRDLSAILAEIHGYTDEQGVHIPIIHRDITPNNVMVGKRGWFGNRSKKIWLIDFGMAQLALQQAGVPMAPPPAGETPGFVAPEQHNGQTDPRSDIYALGMVLRSLLGEATQDSSTPPSSRTRRGKQPKVPNPSVTKLIHRTTHPDPAERPSARAVHEQIELILANKTARTQVRGLSTTLLFACIAGLLVLLLFAQLIRPTPAVLGGYEAGNRTAARLLDGALVDLMMHTPRVDVQPPPPDQITWNILDPWFQDGLIIIDAPPLQGQIEQPGEIDSWRLTSNTTIEVTIWAEGEDADIMLILVDAQGYVIDSDADSGGKFALIHYMLQGGETYHVWIRSLDEESSYDVAVVSNHVQGSLDLRTGQRIGVSNPVTVHQWIVAGSRAQQITLRAHPTNRMPFDLIMSLISPRGTLLISARTRDDLSPPELNNIILPEDGRYTVRVVAAPFDTAEYELQVSTPLSPDPVPVAPLPQAQALEIDLLNRGTIETSGENELWTFVPPADGWYAIQSHTTSVDLDLGLGLSGDALPFEESDRNAGGEVEVLVEFLHATVPYTVSVHALPGSAGEYDLSVVETKFLRGYTFDEIETTSDIDYWTFIPSVSGEYTIYGQPQDSYLDLVLGLDGGKLEDVYFEGESEQMSAYFEAGEPYLISVFGYEDSTGLYMLEVVP